jgi:hypothetical protein
VKVTKRQLRRIILESLQNLSESPGFDWSDKPSPVKRATNWKSEQLPSALEELPGYQEIHDELEPVIMRLAGLHGDDPVAGVLESLVSQLKQGY